MNLLLRSSIWLTTLILIRPCTGQFSQLTESKEAGKAILEVNATYRDDYELIEHSYLVLRVLSDQTAEWQSLEKEPTRSEIFRKALSRSDFGNVVSIVNDRRIKKLQSSYALIHASPDTSTEWTISIPHGTQSQVIKIVQGSVFRPGLQKLFKRPLPATLVKLGCTIEKIRDQELATGDDHLDDECLSVLKMPAKGRAH